MCCGKEMREGVLLTSDKAVNIFAGRAAGIVCCSVLQYVAVCCSVLQRVAVSRSVLQYVAVC